MPDIFDQGITTSIYSIDVDALMQLRATGPPVARTSVNLDIRKRLQHFIDTGSAPGLILETSSEYELIVKSDRKLLMIRNGTIIGLRVLKPMLEKLAKREGLNLRLVDTDFPASGGRRRISYYGFSNCPEVDDSDLFRASFRSQYLDHDDDEDEDMESGGFGNPECEVCY